MRAQPSRSRPTRYDCAVGAANFWGDSRLPARISNRIVMYDFSASWIG